jgi:hypothetical protein
MDDSTSAPLNTREFVVKWHATVDEHLVTRLADSLAQLQAAQTAGYSPLETEQRRMVAHQVVTALHVARDSGIPEAVDYLMQVMGDLGPH